MSNKNDIDPDDIPIPRDNLNPLFNQILQRRISRRRLFGLASLFTPFSNLFAADTQKTNSTGPHTFKELPHGLDQDLHVAENYSYQVVLKWGDPIHVDAEKFNVLKQTATAQQNQFGFNNDFVGYLPFAKENASTHGVLVVNHEYVSSRMMHPDSPNPAQLSNKQIETEIAAHGLSVVEIKKQNQNWHIQKESKLNKRITPLQFAKFSGPASGNARLKNEFSKNGITSLGTFGNCAGCVTPWGTVLTAEENIQTYYLGNAKKTNEYKSYKRFGLLGDRTALSFWGKAHDYWNISKHPNAGLHGGWIVEIDPFDPNFIPQKKTALGRCKHEGCDVHINKDGRTVVYMGDDQAFEYVYRFISKNKFQPGNKSHNLSLLDEGELSVAEFLENGTLKWHPLVWGQEPHTKSNGFNHQADVVIDARYAADLVGATPMDRPEEIKVDPVSGNVFAVFTNNVKRNAFNVDSANPRALNMHGHILELIAPDNDHTANEFKWEVFILAGNPDKKLDNAMYHKNISAHGWFSSPDNCSFDSAGNLWIATDGFNRHGTADGIWVCPVTGADKGKTKHFLRAPTGSEVCSPCFTPDHKTLFCSIQHPGGGSSFDQPSTRWPDFNNDMPPRSAVIAVNHQEGKTIGS